MTKESENMDKECQQLCLCPIQGIIDIVSKKWTLLIMPELRVIAKAGFGFGDVNSCLIFKKWEWINNKDYKEKSMEEKEIFKEIPPRVEYTLKEDGIELRKAVIPLIEWAAKRESGSEKCYPEQCKLPGHHIQP